MFWRLIRLSSLILVLLPNYSHAADQRAILELKLNEIDKGEIIVFLRGDDVLTRVADLAEAGLRADSGLREIIQADNYVSLKSLAPLVSFAINERDLTLRITAQPSLLGSAVFEFQSGRPSDLRYDQSTSGFFNYSLNWRDFKSYGAFGEVGFSIKDNLFYSGISKNEDGTIVRGLSNLTISKRENLNRFVLGDGFANGGVLGGSLTIGGISYFREFSLDPYFVRNPSLHYSGAAATPSTVDVYVNGQLLRRVQVPAGQFELRNLGVPAGSSETRVVIRDAFGREQETFSPFYFTSGLLREGLQEFSYNFGSRRNNLGTESWDYSRVVFLGRHRFGLTDFLTTGLRFEASSRLASGGPTFSLRLPVGEMEFSTAASGNQGLAGAAAFLGYSYSGTPLNWAGSIRLLSPHYATTSLKGSEERSWIELNAITGFPVSSRTNLSLQYTFENSQIKGQKHAISLSTSTRLTDRINLFVNGGHSRQGRENSNEIFSGLTYFFGQTTGSLSYQQRDGVSTGNVALQKSLPLGTGFGYRFQAGANGNENRLDTLLQYQGPYGRYEAGYDRSKGEGSTVLSAAGGLAVIGGGIFPTRPMQDSFALIQVPGVAGVRGYSSNQEVGLSNSDGDLLVPSLLPYYGNRLSIAGQDVPLNYAIHSTEKTIAPPFRGGAIVTFPIQRIQSTMGTVLLESSGQTMIPAYGQLTIAADGKRFESPIGEQGEFYLENVPAGRYGGIIEYKEKLCEFMLEVPDSAEQVVRLGSLRCLNQ
jgi:outer membrane usher protein